MIYVRLVFANIELIRIARWFWMLPGLKSLNLTRPFMLR
jgi:hypothetical protein